MGTVRETALLGAGLVLGLAGAAAAHPAGYYPAPPPAPYPEPVYAPAPAPAPYADGVTVYGRPVPYRVPDHVRELQAGVAFDDLDLATREGRAELDWRIARTADDLCDRLGEGDEAGRNSSVLPTCQASARDSARGQVRRAVEDARYAAAYVPPPPPYPPAAYYPAPAYAPAYAPLAYAQPTYAQPTYAPPPTAWTPPPCACQTAWTPPPPAWPR